VQLLHVEKAQARQTKLKPGAFFKSYWLDVRFGNLSPKERKGFFASIAFGRRKREALKKQSPASRIKGGKPEFDSNLMKKHFNCQER